MKFRTDKVARSICGLCTLVASSNFAASAQAALGDDVSAIEQDRVRMQATLRRVALPNA